MPFLAELRHASTISQPAAAAPDHSFLSTSAAGRRASSSFRGPPCAPRCCPTATAPSGMTVRVADCDEASWLPSPPSVSLCDARPAPHSPPPIGSPSPTGASVARLTSRMVGVEGLTAGATPSFHPVRVHSQSGRRSERATRSTGALFFSITSTSHVVRPGSAAPPPAPSTAGG